MKNKRFFSFITAVIMIFSLCTVLPAKVFVPFEASATGYNANVAIDYALKYWNNYNPNYSDYNSIGGDCANFVSQCLYTGGLEMTDKWFWYSYSNRSGSWASCPDMYNYFNEQGYKIIENPSDSQVLPGNIVLYYSSSKGRWSHAAICVGSNLNGPIVAAHNTNHCDANWKLGSNWSKRCTIIINDNPVPTPELVTPTISTDKSSYTVGDTVNISWTASPSGSNLSHYWLNVIAPDGTWIYGDTMNKNTSYSFTAQQSGNYTVTTYATPIGSLEGEGSLTDTKTIYVKSKNISYDLSLSETYIELEPNQSKDIVLTIRGGDFSGGEDIGKLNLDTSACDKIVDISNTTGGKASSYITMSFKVTALSSGSGSCRFYVTLDGKTIGSVNLNIVVKVNKCKVKLIDNFRHDTIDEYEAECGTAFSYSQLPDMGKEGYKFDGWYNGNQKYSVGSIVPEVSELRLYAQWTVNDNYYDVNSGRYGDINGDGKISAVDASRITMYINGTYELTDLEKIYADLDGSGVIDEYDVRIISLMYTHAHGNETFEELAAKEGWEEKYLYTCHPLLSLKVNGQSSYEAKPGETVKLTMEVEGADSKYCSVNLYFKYSYDIVQSDVKYGNAVKYLATSPWWGGSSSSGYKYISMSTAGSDNQGMDGIMFEAKLTIPEDVETGTVYPIEFLKWDDLLFTNKLNDNIGKKMQQDAFNNWQNCSIRVIGGKGDVNSDGKVTVADAVMLKKWLLAVPNAKLDNWKSADLYDDGRIDVFDMVEMRKLLIENK